MARGIIGRAKECDSGERRQRHVGEHVCLNPLPRRPWACHAARPQSAATRPATRTSSPRSELRAADFPPGSASASEETPRISLAQNGPSATPIPAVRAFRPHTGTPQDPRRHPRTRRPSRLPGLPAFSEPVPGEPRCVQDRWAAEEPGLAGSPGEPPLNHHSGAGAGSLWCHQQPRSALTFRPCTQIPQRFQPALPGHFQRLPNMWPRALPSRN